MQVSFLSAADGTPLTKRFSQKDGKIEKTSYPMVKGFTSTTYQIDTIQQFYERTQHHAEQGHCLLKGHLSRELRAESRAGSTQSHDSTSWLLFDLDRVPGIKTPEQFVREVLPEAFQEVSYVLHWSSSSGFADGISCHLSFMLSTGVPAQYLKTWLELLNYGCPVLRDNLDLNATGTALRYPLDITTCQNDKLIFIAHPQFEGLDDPIPNRIELIEKSKQFVNFQPPTDLNPTSVQKQKEGIIDALREEKGLPKKKIATKQAGQVEYITNPDEAFVTGRQTARGFTYLNLNGGDSWAYYFPEDEPTYLKSFKEPGDVWRLQDINKDFYKAYCRELDDKREALNEEGKHPFCFFNMDRDQHFAGWYNLETGWHNFYPVGSKGTCNDFYKEHGVAPPKSYPLWKIVFDPSNTSTIDVGRRWINTFVPTEALTNPTKEHVEHPPELIHRIIFHALGEDIDTYNKFMNWLACIYQTRDKMITAWVLTGVEGTGKGLICEHILPALFGDDYVQTRGLENLEDGFSGWLEKTLIFNFNEARLSDSKLVSKLINKLKIWITDRRIPMRAMRREQTMIDNHMNIIVTSNHNDAIVVTIGDRRWHIAPRQRQKLEITPDEVASIPSLILDFAGYLAQYETDVVAANTVEFTEAKAAMVEAGMTAHEQYFDALNNGNLEFFAQYLTTQPQPDEAYEYNEYDRIVKQWLYKSSEETTKVYREDLLYVYNYIQAGGRKLPQNKFSRACSTHDLKLKQMRRDEDGSRTYGLELKWDVDPETVSDWLTSNTPNQPSKEV